MAKRTRRTYSAQKRAADLLAAERGNLTANDVTKKFRVVPVTYYSWRKTEGLVGPRGRRPSRLTLATKDGALLRQIRAGVQARVRSVMPRIVREVVSSHIIRLAWGLSPRT
jgi:transposase-like protein